MKRFCSSTAGAATPRLVHINQRHCGLRLALPAVEERRWKAPRPNCRRLPTVSVFDFVVAKLSSEEKVRLFPPQNKTLIKTLSTAVRCGVETPPVPSAGTLIALISATQWAVTVEAQAARKKAASTNTLLHCCIEWTRLTRVIVWERFSGGPGTINKRLFKASVA